MLRAPDGVRLDSGISEGQTITTAFDPMLAKLIVHGKDREEARQRALTALRQFVLLGCETNTGFLRRLIAHPAFREGDVHTGFIDAHPEIAAESIPQETLQRMLATSLRGNECHNGTYGDAQTAVTIAALRQGGLA